MAYKSTDATADIKATSTANSAMGSTTLVTVHTTSSCHCNATVEPVSKAMTSTTTLVAVSTITSPATMATTSSTTVEDHTVSSLHCDSGTSLQDNNGHYKLLLHKRLCLRWMKLGHIIKHVDMFHSQSPDTVKEKIKEDMSVESGNIRVLVATSAAGMGVNFRSVKYVINYGPPKDMDGFVQQFGRAGRDGGVAMALLLFNDENNGYTARFLGYSVYISNSTNKDHGVLCFKDTNYTKNTIPNPTNITCITHGRYVIYYNNRTHPLYPAGYDQYAFNGLCKVEVYGCPIPGYYGEDCSLSCPQNCQEGHCHIVDGTCLGCVPGYKGPTCNEKCIDQTYGLECQQICGNCKNKEPCHHVNGSCLNGCDSGYYGDKCNLTCPEGRYGSNCQEQCNVNCGVPYRCDRVTGQCEGGCQVEWKGQTCDTQCDGGKFGENCSSLCGKCREKEQCHYISGTCPNGCDSGYKGSHCTLACNNDTYGTDCSMKCGNCLYLHGEQCHHVTGQFLRGCGDGFHGGLCDQENLALNKPAWQQHPYYGRMEWGAERAVDGLYTNLSALEDSVCYPETIKTQQNGG
uniref:Scavenger receptor class F member 2 n=1 Tax=Magallana gigas TaxID=29159 RepID=K1QIZ9_MAGGI